MIAYNIMISLDINPCISRTLLVPKEITFKKLHEIICIVFNLDEDNKYKFLFEDIGLIIQDTGSLNRDHIDSRFELIDEYFQGYSGIKYINSFGAMLIKITPADNVKEYPEIIGIEGKYNPLPESSIEEYLDDLTENNSAQNDKLIKVNAQEIQEALLILFKINYTIENNEIILLREEETLENYI